MNIFLTGATGFLGRRVLARLLEQGHRVTALVRSRNACQWIAAHGAEVVQGDLAGLSGWAKHLQDQEVVVHCAAPVVFWGPWANFEADILQASCNLYRAAGRAGVKRFIYISSESVMQASAPLLDVDESYPCERTNSPYSRAKLLTERALLNEAWGPALIILRPAFIWGAGMSALDAIEEKIAAGQFLWVSRGKASMEMVHVDNVAHAVCCALEKGRSGDIFLLTDDSPDSVRQFLGDLLQARQVTIPERSVPNWLVQPSAFLLHAIWEALNLNQAPPISRFEWAFVAQPRRYNIRKAKDVLNYRPIVSRDQGLAAMRLEAAMQRQALEAKKR